MNKFLLTLLSFFAFFAFSTITFSQDHSTCALAEALVLDMNCSGTSGGANSGDPTGFDGTDGNVCSGSYSGGDDYIYSFTGTGDALQLDLTGTGSWSGLMVTEGCPTTGTCVGSSTSSSTSESLTTPALTVGVVYYIHISTWPSPQSIGQFCLNAESVSAPTPPVNDDCGSPTPLTVNSDLSCSIVSSSTIALATASGEDETTCSGTENDDVWFSFTATATSHEIELLNITGGTTDLYHSVWSGTCGALTNLLCSDPNNSTVSGLTIGDTYLLRVNSWTSTAGQTSVFDVCIGTLPPPPSNDACGNAIAVMSGSMISGSTASATNIEGLTACNGGTIGASCATGVNDGTTDFGAGVWFVYTSQSAESVTIEVDGFDTELQVFSGTCGSLTCVAGDDDSHSSGCCGSQVCFDSQASFAPVDYYIYVDGHGTNTGTFDLTINAAVLPLDLLEWRGTSMETGNKLTWTTANEVNTSNFSIEKLFNNNDWRSIGTLDASGNSAEILNYEFMDESPEVSELYRLKSMDLDGTYTYSDVIEIKREVKTNEVNVYPNPFANDVKLDIELIQNQDISITIYDMTGKLVSELNYEGISGKNSYTLNMAEQQVGVYLLSIQLNNSVIQKRIIKK